MSRSVSLATLAGVLLVAGGAAGQPPESPVAPVLSDITESSGVRLVHDPGDLTGYPLAAIMGAGAALFDANDDGALDLYLIQSGPLPHRRNRVSGSELPTNRLYVREADGPWRDATDESGLGDTGYGVGVAVGDVDGDGDPDVFVANHGEDALYLGQNGVFERADAGLDGARWSTASALCDYDADGDLDLYVGGYLVDPDGKECVNSAGEPDFCSPQSLPYERDALYRNRGDGQFDDVSGEAGILAERRPALGVLCHDFTGDGRLDFYVANDGEPNLLWEQTPDGVFEDAALMLGTALNGQGRAEAGMGVVLGDVDGDADLDLYLTHLRAQTNTLYRNQGLGFLDATPASGLALPSLPRTGFGVRFLDLELDGDLDLLVLNGAVARAEGTPPGPGLDAYAETAQAFVGDGAGRFEPVEIAEFTDRAVVGRSLLTGDLDGDGDLDVVTTEVGGPVRLFENRTPRRGSWLAVEPTGGPGPVSGAVATLEIAVGGESRVLVRPLNPEAGYLSSSEPVFHFGILEDARVTALRVRWPDGDVTEHPPPAVDRRVRIQRP